jgi:hypothetical protein
MNAAAVHCGMYDPDRSTDTLLAETAWAARRAGLGAGVGASVVAVPHPGPGGLVEVLIRYPDLAPALREPWTAMGSRLAEVLTTVRPALAAINQKSETARLPQLTWSEAQDLLDVGWVRETTLTPAQREAFEALRRRRWVRRLGDGLTWGAGRMWSLSDGILRGDGEDLTAAVFEAWTGTPASPRTPSPDPLAELVFESNPLLPEAEVDQDELNRVNPPELWFWHHDLDEDDLVRRVATALPRYEVEYDEDQNERWRAVVAYPPAQLTDQESLLQDLRQAVVTVEPDWAALQPRGGFAVPGLDPDLPASGVLDHPWVRRQWIGDRLPQLRAALGPVTPEVVGDGLLFVTARDPRAPQTGATPWVSSDERYAAVVEAARILGEAAVDAVDPL